ncbi:helicase HerA domain-containing protein [Ruminococcus flavefaciens]|uniref:Helicase HerA central domain-containing protein n=1 Tax=Ruminococcus flavefaciens 007c TaxID=1341157 RepID=W7UEJ5_RUMFL|nr:DUF87 domain-containing protein [Ruminococcus flavefaciens]EWM52363.1 hypothetical protein RF007C_13515 [Ruminococcus flavefaciens 007c]
MNTRRPTSNQPQNQGQVLQPISEHELAVETAKELIGVQKRLGLTLTIYDGNLNRMSGTFESIWELINNPEFISKLTQDFYFSDKNESRWFKVKIRKGKLIGISFLIGMKTNWVKIYNFSFGRYAYIVIGFYPGVGNIIATTSAIPFENVTPEKVTQHFPQLIGQTANNKNDIGKILCFIINKFTANPSSDICEYIGPKQGFNYFGNNNYLFSPPHLLRDEIKPYLNKGLLSRQHPYSCSDLNDDLSKILIPLFKNKRELQILLLYRLASWLSAFFAKKDVYSDNILIVKPSTEVPVALSIALLRNTSYASLEAPPIGPNIKSLKFELENVNDGLVVAIDVFAADQLKKGEKGFDLMINDATRAKNNGNGVHHISALISKFADLYIPKEVCCVLEFDNVSTNYSPETFKNALRRLDANVITRIEDGCKKKGAFLKVFNNHINEIMHKMPCALPRSKYFTYIMLMAALRMYNEWYSPLFCLDIEKYIVDWLGSQEQDRQPLYDTICSEYGKILNQKIADGYFHLIPKDEVTLFDKGSHAIIVDKAERRIYIETADSFDIAKDEMTSIVDTDSLTAALYSGGYLPHNAKNEKSVRIAAITSDGTPYPLYVHAISYKLLTQENKLKFELLDKEANLFTYDELQKEGILPLIKTVDGRFAGKKLRYEAEESNSYFGTGKTGSGKSWAIAQLICMLFMLGHTAVVFDVSGSYTKEKLLKMLPTEVVEKLFRFIYVGAGKDPVPVDLGSLRGCETLPDKKRSIHSVLRAATGAIDKSTSRKLKGFLSEYLNNKEYSISLNDLCSKLEEVEGWGAEIVDCVQSVLDDIKEVGFEEQTWDDLFVKNKKIIVINLGNEVGDSNHQLLDMLVGSLFNWQMTHDSGFLSIAIDELIDQDFSTGSPLQTIVKQGRKFHTALIGATQDYYNQGSSHLDVMKQSNIKSFCRPGKSEDRVAQKLGYSNAVDAGFNKFKAGDTLLEFDGYNKETGENEALTMKGRVVNFVETPLYQKFHEIYGCY